MSIAQFADLQPVHSIRSRRGLALVAVVRRFIQVHLLAYVVRDPWRVTRCLAAANIVSTSMAADSFDAIPKDSCSWRAHDRRCSGVCPPLVRHNFFACYLAFLWIAHATVSIRGVVCLLIGPVMPSP
jgi:hypothetical protein